MRPATSELAAVAWLKSLDGLGNGVVSTQLPKDQDSWAATGFVVVGPDVGGTQNGYVPWRESVLQLSTYGVRPRTLNPDWATANYLAELIVDAAIAGLSLGVTLPTRDGYHAVRVTSAAPASTPRRVPTDPSSYALYRTDLSLNWVQVDLPDGDES